MKGFSSVLTGSSILEHVTPAHRFHLSTRAGESSHAAPMHESSAQRHHGHRVHLRLRIDGVRPPRVVIPCTKIIMAVAQIHFRSP